MSLKTITWERVKGHMSEDLIKKITEITEVKGRYINNIELDVRNQDPELSNQFLDELEQIEYEIKQLSDKNDRKNNQCNIHSGNTT